ncbi:carbonic anhydrase [Geopyxis carbonaria]|nr:carbonic anhydrase [Geopyxis carbonaria]
MAANSSNINALVEGNKSYVANLPKSQRNLPLPPANHFAIVTCMDARIDPAAAFGLKLGSTHIIRNGGGSARDALRSLTISQQLLETTEIAIVKHTDCGMMTFKNDDLRSVIKKNLGVEVAKGEDYHVFSDPEKAVKEDVEWLKNCELISGESKKKISGWVYRVEDGSVTRVV